MSGTKRVLRIAAALVVVLVLGLAGFTAYSFKAPPALEPSNDIARWSGKLERTDRVRVHPAVASHDAAALSEQTSLDGDSTTADAGIDDDAATAEVANGGTEAPEKVETAVSKIPAPTLPVPEVLAEGEVPAEGDSVALSSVTVITPTIGRIEDSTVFLEGDEISRIVEGGDPDSPYAGHYVLPGLIDMHTHLTPQVPVPLDQLYGLLYLKHGVTAVRDAADLDATAVPIATKAFEEGTFPMPRFYSCGPFVDAGKPKWANTVLLEDGRSADDAVREIKAQGYRCIKSYDGLSPAQIKELVAAADAQDIPVMGHVPGNLRYEEAGVPEIQHLYGVPLPEHLADHHSPIERMSAWDEVDDARMQEIVDATVAQGLSNTPTLVNHARILSYRDYEAARTSDVIQLIPRNFYDIVWHPVTGLPFYRNMSDELLDRYERTLEKKLELVRRLYEAGTPLYLGTDTQQPFVVPGAAVHEEMRLFAEAGIPAEDIWAMATWHSADRLGEPRLGRIEPGAAADLLVFSQDPTESLDNLDSLVAVVARGQLHPVTEIDDTVQSTLDFFRQPLVDVATEIATKQKLAEIIKE